MGKFRRPLKASLSAERRDAQRRRLRLTASTQTADGASDVLIHDLSENGLNFETDSNLRIGEIVLVDLPFIGVTESKVIWQDGAQFGCEFLTPILSSSLSAALLRQRNDEERSEPGGLIEEVEIGVRPSLDEITEWKVNFEQTRAKSGYRVVGFRQSSEGALIAMISKAN